MVQNSLRVLERRESHKTFPILSLSSGTTQKCCVVNKGKCYTTMKIIQESSIYFFVWKKKTKQKGLERKGKS